jgi:hypothetical protein
MKEIILNHGEKAMVDDEDYEYLSQWNWYCLINYKNKYAVRTDFKNGEYKKSIRMHRVIMNTPRKLTVDHIDGNGLNNQKANLRNCTVTENIYNRRKHKNGTSSFKGVSIASILQKGRLYKYYLAQIRKDGVGHNLVYYKNEKDAAMAYNEAAIKLFGQFANLNKY